MNMVIRSEWIKLRTVMSHWVLVGIAIAFPVIVTVLAVALGNWSEFNASSDASSLVVGLCVVTAMVLGAMTATSLTSEYSHNTIRPTFAATPSRPNVHVGKLIVVSGAVLLAGLLAAFGSWFLAQGILAVRDVSISLGSGSSFARLVSVVLLCVLVTWFGYGLGLLIRNAPATITLLLLWPLIIENLLLGLFAVTGADAASKWLPYTAAINAAVDGGDNFDDVLGRPWGLVWFGFVSMVLVGIGLLTDHRRDA